LALAVQIADGVFHDAEFSRKTTSLRLCSIGRFTLSQLLMAGTSYRSSSGVTLDIKYLISTVFRNLRFTIGYVSISVFDGT